MARIFDSDDPEPVLRFSERIECPSCGEEFEGLFVDRTRSHSVQDMSEPPVGDHVCPWCGHGFSSEFGGWLFFSEAG